MIVSPGLLFLKLIAGNEPVEGDPEGVEELFDEPVLSAELLIACKTLNDISFELPMVCFFMCPGSELGDTFFALRFFRQKATLYPAIPACKDESSGACDSCICPTPVGYLPSATSFA